jgi:hypothetical protein
MILPDYVLPTRRQFVIFNLSVIDNFYSSKIVYSKLQDRSAIGMPSPRSTRLPSYVLFRFAEDGSPLDAAAITERRDVFLQTALDGLAT